MSESCECMALFRLPDTFTIDDLAAIECMAVSCRIMTCLSRTALRSELSE